MVNHLGLRLDIGLAQSSPVTNVDVQICDSTNSSSHEVYYTGLDYACCQFAGVSENGSELHQTSILVKLAAQTVEVNV